MPLLLDWFVQPLGLVFTALIISQLWLLRVSGVSRLLKLWLACTTGLLWVSSAPLTANGLVFQVEKPIAAIAQQCDAFDEQMRSEFPVVVLGADLDAYVESDSPYEVLTSESLSRTLYAATLDTGNNRFYLMGGGQTSRKLSDFMARVLINQGIASERIERDNVSLNTVQNAEQLALLPGISVSVPIVLVTSSLHMNRAASIFSTQGFTSCPSPSGSLYSVSAGWVGLLPYIDALTKSTFAWRELLATVKYRLLKPGEV